MRGRRGLTSPAGPSRSPAWPKALDGAAFTPRVLLACLAAPQQCADVPVGLLQVTGAPRS